MCTCATNKTDPFDHSFKKLTHEFTSSSSQLRTVPTTVIAHTVRSAHLKILGFPIGDAY